jgi:hypothetical protein
MLARVKIRSPTSLSTENLFKRLETYTEVPLTHAMTDTIVKIMVVVLGILAIATKEIKQGSASEPILFDIL